MSRRLILLLFPLLLVACGGEPKPAADGETAEAAPAAGDYERGPHRGRMLRDGEFALEVTIFETNVPPQFRLYAYQDGKPLPANSVMPTITLERLDGEVNRFTFKPEGGYLTGSGTVVEPHSFDVEVKAEHAGKSHTWKYASYEGRTTIPAKAAEDAGVVVETAGPALIRDTVQVMGNVAVDANRFAQVKARFPGVVRAVHVQQGQRVKRGQPLVTVEGNDSMRSYSVAAPFDGIVLSRPTNVGDVADSNTLVELANLADVWVELRAIGPDAEKIAPGQPVKIASATGESSVEGTLDMLLPLASGQSVVARASIPNPEGRWRPGMTVSAEVTVAAREVPLAVKESGLQRFRDFTVVFAQVGETYEVRMLELGARDGEHAEVLGGLKPGTAYVTEQSFLIKADIDKSGASHDH
ncbi:TPA: efflux RND transporter periplasmic adaptor subunit [Stenotrophomonas maltophilia]|nr:efflux RND transporter periplasmic adaptor subunit [Stenotrophomonas maltophilia]